MQARKKSLFEKIIPLGIPLAWLQLASESKRFAVALAGMKASTGNLEKPNSKAESYKLSKEILKQFKEQNGSVICKELKGVGTGTPLRSCQDCIKDAAAIAERVLFNEEA